MINFTLFIQFLIIISFFIYGTSCFVSPYIRREFARYQLSSLRPWIGAAQILTSLCLFAGFYLPYLTILSSLVFTLMMLGAIVVRIRIRDSVWQTLPAILYFVLTLFLFLKTWMEWP